MSVKAFELIDVVEKNVGIIKCFEASGNDLYLGCDEGLLLRYIIGERTDPATEKSTYSANVVAYKDINCKKSVEQLKAASALSRLLVLVDGNLYLLESESLNFISSSPKVKNVLVFCVNENPTVSDPFTLQFCVGKRKGLQICSLHEDKVFFLREIATQDAVVNIAMDGRFVCMASITQYCIYDVETGKAQSLFPSMSQSHYPHIKRISKEEFLVVGPGNLGMLVTSAGTSERPPIQWAEGILSISYYHPYVITMTPRFISVYSLIDQQHKQTLPLVGGNLVGNFDGQLYVATDFSIYCLMPQPWTSQVMDLLENGSTGEALELTKHNRGAGMTNEKYICFSQNVFQRIGFIKFMQESFLEAQDFFISGKLDVRELLSLYPGLLETTSFTRCLPPLHHIADVNQAFHGDKEKVKKAKEFLINFLFYIRNSKEAIPFHSEIDAALIKLYSESDYDKLLLFLESRDITCPLEETVEWLKKRNQYFAMAKLYKCFNKIESCISLMEKLIHEKYEENNFQGVAEIVNVITDCSDSSIIWRHAGFIFERNIKEGIRLFCETSVALDHEKVLVFLYKYPTARYEFLRHLIYNKGSQIEGHHTELALYYLNEVLRSEKQSETEARSLLLQLLISSKYYNSNILLNHLESTDLVIEKAFVYGKLKQHEKALSLLVHTLRDFSAAEEYCIEQSKDVKKEESSRIYLTLLGIYLTPTKSGCSNSIEVAPALDLLSVHATEFELKDVLQILPSDWSMSVAHQYLKVAFRDIVHRSRIKKVQNNLIKCENFQQKYIFHKLCNSVGPISLSSNRMCYLCGKGFKDSSFSLYPNGVITHKECSTNPNVCPLTGTIFKVTEANISNN